MDDAFGTKLGAWGFRTLNLYRLLRGISEHLCIPGGPCWRTHVLGDRWAPRVGTQTFPLQVTVGQSFQQAVEISRFSTLKPVCAAFLSPPCRFAALISVFCPLLQGLSGSWSFFSPQSGAVLKRIIEINCLIN